MIGEHVTHPEFQYMLDQMIASGKMNSSDLNYCQQCKKQRTLKRKEKVEIYRLIKKYCFFQQKIELADTPTLVSSLSR